MTFELRVVGADGNTQSPPLLTAADLASVKAVTKSAWYVLSGSHQSSKLVLTVKPTSLSRWLNAIAQVARRGDRLAIVVDGKSMGIMVVMQTPTGADFEIAGAFLASGTEDEQAKAVKTLANRIQGALK